MASEAALEAAAFVQALVNRGITQKTIGAAVGRNDSLISQIRRGTGKGASLRDRLAELVARADEIGASRATSAEDLAGEGEAPARRQTATGRIARVRRAVAVKGNGWSTANVKQQAAKHGGNGLIYELRDGAAAGRVCAFDVTFAAGGEVEVLQSSGKPAKRTKKAGGHKRHGWTVTLGDHGNLTCQTALDAVNQQGSVVAGVLWLMEDRGLISYDGTPANVMSGGVVLAVELRTWTP